MGVGAFYTFLPKNETIVAENLPLETKLPDGTEITINKNSEISYNNRYNKKNRTIQLKGDAFFKVQKNNDISFIIEAQDFFVEVMGTQFYVNSNPKQRKVIVTEGIVAVYREKDKKDMIVLSAGEEIIFDKTENTLTKTETQNLNVLSWKTKQFTFKDKTLEEVAAELEAVYAVTFEFLNENLKSCRLSVSFDNQEIEEILNVLTATFEKVSFKREGQKIYIDGSACY
jgi:ferric-dicitrate binding protein FerR (iron transport regulator)